MKKSVYCLFAVTILTLFSGQSVKAGLTNSIYWNFVVTSPVGFANPSSNSFAGLTVSSLSSSNSFGGYANGYSGAGASSFISGSSASTAYTTAAGFSNSGSTNAGVAAAVGALSASSAFFQATISLDAASAVSYGFTNVSFGARSTSTGAQLFSLYTSADNLNYTFASSVSLANNSVWTALALGGLALELDPGESLYLRLYASGGAGSPSSGTVNTRIDDLSIAFNTQPVPEPSTIALAALGGFACLFALRRKH